MNKLSSLLIVLIIGISMAPASFAKNNRPVYIKDATVFTREFSSGVSSSITICNTNASKTQLILRAKNIDIKSTYKRNLLLPAEQCSSFDLFFTKTFSENTKLSDRIKFSLTNVQSVDSNIKYSNSKSFTTLVRTSNNIIATYDNQDAQDGEYNIYVGSFITHKDTGARIKLIKHVSRSKWGYINVVVSNIKWGRTKNLRVYEGRSKDVITNNGTRLVITYIGQSVNGDALIEIKNK